MTQTDKEKIKESLELIDDFEKRGQHTPLPLIRDIKKILEK